MNVPRRLAKRFPLAAAATRVPAWVSSFLLAVSPLLTTQAVLATEPAATREAEDWFEQRVRPLLVAKCLECHGERDPEAGLSLVSRASVLQGGDSGPAAVPGQPAKSLLVEAVRRSGRVQMPTTGKLRDDEIATLTRWVELGLPWPTPKPGVAPAKTSSGMGRSIRSHPRRKLAVDRHRRNFAQNAMRFCYLMPKFAVAVALFFRNWK